MMFFTPVSSKRLIRPKTPTDFKTTNTVVERKKPEKKPKKKHDATKAAVYRNFFSFFLSFFFFQDHHRLEQSKSVSTETIESLKEQISRSP